MKVTVVILTFNEEIHLERAIASVREFADKIVIVDSGSTDRTREIANDCGAIILTNNWINYATQFNWALAQLSSETEWVMRLDADEIVMPNLAAEIRSTLSQCGSDIDGIYVSRRMTFMRRPIRYGGLFPIRVLRIFRYGQGRCENRWMDEHIIVEGKVVEFQGEVLDDNLKSINWWTDKHNGYSSREAVDLLNLEFGFSPHETVASLSVSQQSALKRWVKEKIYAGLPPGLRALIYFLFRYFLKLGFLDGWEGTAFHVLQGFWYRYLVDVKLYETKSYMHRNNVDPIIAIERVLGICVR